METHICLFRHFKKLYNNRFGVDHTVNYKIDKSKYKKHDSPIIDFTYNDNDFSDYEIIIVSPYLRTRQTYEKIFKNREYIIDTRIREYLGHKANLYNKLELENETRLYVNDIPGTETEEDFEKRCIEFLEDILDKYKGKKIFVITHSFVMLKIEKYNKDKNYNIKYFYN